MTAYGDKDVYLAATAPLSADLVLGYDLDPASTDDFRHLVSQSLSPGGYVVGGIQLTEASPDAAADAAAPPPPHHHHHHHHHAHEDHHGVKGNAYNFASSPQHTASFDLVQGQLSEAPCFRRAPSEALGCVEVGANWFESLCALGDHLGGTPQLVDAFVEFTAGWPTGSRGAERCAAQRHFLGFVDDPAGEGLNLRNPYFHRSLMGFCMFHSCKEVASLGASDLAASGVAVVDAADGSVPHHYFATV
mmetsp:Transcript_54986/g.163607  ORF Transcript_54986/g.163607 Transcript_54986/m.163607 type:complete len:247 (+) Transcript_54986:1448-2188(+)